jgi:hypothetical protein
MVLLNDGCRSQIGQEQRSYKRCANDGFRAIENNIACNADHGQDEREHAFEGELKNFDESHDRRAYTERNQFGPDRDAVIPEELITVNPEIICESGRVAEN